MWVCEGTEKLHISNHVLSLLHVDCLTDILAWLNDLVTHFLISAPEIYALDWVNVPEITIKAF